jgi:glyoxylate reductase
MEGSRQVAVIARVLLPAGRDLLVERYELREGGLDATPEQLRELVPGADAIVVDPAVPVDAELLDAAGPQLKVVANFAVGHDNIDLAACRGRGVVATNTPGVLTEATAELALALTLAAARRLSDAERDLRAGRWQGWDPAAYRGLELRESTVGVIGLGRIGGRYAEMVRALGARVVYSANTPKPDPEVTLGAQRMELEPLLRAADVVSIHTPGGEGTRGMIGAAELDAIGPDGVLVNTARGTVVDAAAVAAALRDGRLGAAGFDVYPDEPDVPPELLEAPRCVLLPHIGSATVASRDAMAQLAAENVIAVLEGREPPARIS